MMMVRTYYCCAIVFVVGSLHADLSSALAQSRGLTGVSSCTAAGCHGAAEPDVIVGSEYNVWISSDPHARAYNVLWEPESVRMVQLLDGKPLGTPVAPYKDARCLACHSITSDPTSKFASDGVSCEVCHGPADEWLATHYESGFQSLSAAEREEKYNFWNTDSLARRVDVCVDCHVGSPGRDVNHDLIAAGHPRLQFEMGAFFHALPKHWVDAEDRSTHGTEFDAVLWTLGQAKTSQAALELLAHRAGQGHPWPEFAEWSCAACHHDLRDNVQQQQLLAERGGLSGRSIAWDDWNHHFTRRYLELVFAALDVDPELTSELKGDFAAIDATMHQPIADGELVSQQATMAAERLGKWVSAVERAPWNARTTDRVSRDIAEFESDHGLWKWTTAAQAYDALASLHQSRLNRRGVQVLASDELTRAIGQLHEGLRGYIEAPVSYRYDPQEISAQLERVRRALEQTGGEG